MGLLAFEDTGLFITSTCPQVSKQLISDSIGFSSPETSAASHPSYPHPSCACIKTKQSHIARDWITAYCNINKSIS